MTKMGEKVKKFLPWLATITLCLVIAVTLFIVLPLLTPSNADNDTSTPPVKDDQQHQVGENPSIDDQQGTSTPDQGNTTPSEPTQPDPVEPVNPTPTEPEPPVEPTPIEPEAPDTPSETPVFVLTKGNLRGTVWYDAENKLCLIFDNNENTYTLTRIIFTDGIEGDQVILRKDIWKLQKGVITLSPGSSENSNTLVYADNTLTDPNYGYHFTWQLDAIV